MQVAIRASFVVVLAASAATLQACSFPEPFQATELPTPVQSAREELQALLSQPQNTTDRCFMKDVVLGRHLYLLGAPPASGLVPGDRPRLRGSSRGAARTGRAAPLLVTIGGS